MEAAHDSLSIDFSLVNERLSPNYLNIPLSSFFEHVLLQKIVLFTIPNNTHEDSKSWSTTKKSLTLASFGADLLVKT